MYKCYSGCSVFSLGDQRVYIISSQDLQAPELINAIVHKCQRFIRAQDS